jgi:PAS domain-containing protein
MNLQNSTKEELIKELERLNQRYDSIAGSLEEEIRKHEQTTLALKLQNFRLEGSKAKLEAALNSMNDAVFISDMEGNFIDFNEAFATFHKFKNKDECAKTLKEYPLFLDVYKSDGILASLGEWAVPRALRGETATNQEYTLYRKDTGETWIGSYSLAPIRDQAGLIVGSVVTGRDITAQKQTEGKIKELNKTLELKVVERTRQLSEELEIRKQRESALNESQVNLMAVFNATNESVFLVSADSDLIALNEIAKNRLTQSADSLIGRNVFDILPPQVAETRRPFINQVLTTCKPVVFEDERDGRWMINSIYPITSDALIFK